MISSISSFEIINVVNPDSNTFLWQAASVANAAAVNPNGIKTLLANGLSTFPIKDNPIFSNGPKNLPKNSSYCPILCNWAFDNFILAEEQFEKALRSLKTCVLINDSLFEKLFSPLEWPIIFDERFKVTPVPFFIANFNLLSWDWNCIVFGSAFNFCCLLKSIAINS